jgi:hypothetical protein
MSVDSKFQTALFAINYPMLINVSILDTGVPIKLLYQGEGHTVTVELKNGEIYRGLLARAEDTMNCQLKEGKDFLPDISTGFNF